MLVYDLEMLAMTARCEPRPRLLPERAFPPYAYLPGKFPHPIRHPLGHSYDPGTTALLDNALPDPESFRWGIDLFNYGYYWEAHEAWEPLWRATKRNSTDREMLKGLILLAAAGVKLRERKNIAARRHARRAATLFRGAVVDPHSPIEHTLGMASEMLAAHAETSVSLISDASLDACDNAVVFSFVLGRIREER